MDIDSSDWSFSCTILLDSTMLLHSRDSIGASEYDECYCTLTHAHAILCYFVAVLSVCVLVHD